MVIKILITDPISDKGLNMLKDAGFDVVYKPNCEESKKNTKTIKLNKRPPKHITPKS